MFMSFETKNILTKAKYFFLILIIVLYNSTYVHEDKYKW